MNTARLQAALDQLLVTSTQRWVLMAVAVGAIVGASAGISIATPFSDTWLVVVVLVIALVVAMDPSEHLGLVLICIVVFQWLTLSPPVASPWSAVLAIGLYLFHSVVALMAVTPHRAVVHRVVLVRWATRSSVVVLATLGVWTLVHLFDQRDARGNAALSALAFGVLGALVLGFAQQTISTGEDATHDS